MPIYEYAPIDADQCCPHCREGFEMIHLAGEKPCQKCPACGHPVKKLISSVRSVIREGDGQHGRVLDQVRTYEKSGMWSHAAELADSYSEKTKDGPLKERAMDNYKRSGMDPD